MGRWRNVLTTSPGVGEPRGIMTVEDATKHEQAILESLLQMAKDQKIHMTKVEEQLLQSTVLRDEKQKNKC